MSTLTPSFVFLTLIIVTAITSVSDSFAADFSAIWDGGNGNWDDPLHWSTNPNYPDNTGGFTYDATINHGTVSLNRDITIQRLFFDGRDTILTGAHELTLNQGMTLTGGSLSSTINLSAGSTSNISTSNISSGPSALGGILNNSGTLNQSAQIFRLYGTINNMAGSTWNLQAGSGMNNDAPHNPLSRRSI
jgi:hypothetical protein